MKLQYCAKWPPETLFDAPPPTPAAAVRSGAVSRNEGG